MILRTARRPASCLFCCQWQQPRPFCASPQRPLAARKDEKQRKEGKKGGSQPSPPASASASASASSSAPPKQQKTAGADSRAANKAFLRAPGIPLRPATELPDALRPGASTPAEIARNEALAHAPRSWGKRHEGKFEPTVLSRPIGMVTPPEPGENAGLDTRRLKQKLEDLLDVEKNLQRREVLKFHFSRPYFRDWRNLNDHRGKTFLSPPRPFKAGLSLYFPNLYGRTLASSTPTDTTPVLTGKASVVTVFSSLWGERQTLSFTAPNANPGLQELLRREASEAQAAEEARAQAEGFGPGRRYGSPEDLRRAWRAGVGAPAAQAVWINTEENRARALLLSLFLWLVRKRVRRNNDGDETALARYFLIRGGIGLAICESIGLLNGVVGYTYLVDHKCRIRWAGSGDANADETESLNKSLARVLQEMREERAGRFRLEAAATTTGAAGLGMSC